MKHLSLMLLLLASVVPAQAAECRKTGTVCVAPNETRTIDGMSVYRECWAYEDTYECLGTGMVEEAACGQLRDRGCSQTGSRCISETEFGCMTYEQIYECPSGEPPLEQAILDCGGQLYCLEDGCFDAGYPPNQNLGRAGAQLSVIKAVSDEMALDSLEIFKGGDSRCGVSVADAVGAQNCCSLSGWAEGTFRCSFEEEQLAQLRNAARTHYVGAYCENRSFLGICTKRTQTYCTFNSKLARIIAEQGRIQLGRGWGSAEQPDCSGFTPEEIRQLDFSAMDLSEFYTDVVESMPTIDQGELEQRMRDRISQQQP